MVGLTLPAVVLLEAGILGLLVVAVRRRDAAATVNALVSFVVVLLPFALVGGVPFVPGLAAWTAVAGFLHTLGMVGQYESRWWWDHLTHTVSAALVAALLYAALIVTRAVGESALVAAVTLGATLTVGVWWELLELAARAVGERYDIEPVLVHYGPRDTALDLVFDLVGALLVVGLDLRTFVPIAAQDPDATAALLAAGAWVVLLSGVAMAAGLGLRARSS